MATVYKHLRPKTGATNTTGFKTITLEEGFKDTTDLTASAAAAARLAAIKEDPTVALNYATSNTTSTVKEFSGLVLESWSITEKTRVYQTTSGTTTTTNTSNHVILKYTIKIQDFWVVS